LKTITWLIYITRAGSGSGSGGEETLIEGKSYERGKMKRGKLSK
jgi:hypothetical protein